MLSRTSSQICGRWYLPMFLLRDGLLALMYRASFMVLKRFWSSLPKMVKLSIVTSWPEMLWWSYMGDGALRCSFNLSSKFLADSPIYSSSQPTLSHLNLYMTPLFYLLGLCPLGTWGGLWWSGHLWDVHQSHIACKCSYSSQWVPVGMGPQCKAWDHWLCWTQVDCCCLFSFFWWVDRLFNFTLLMAQSGYLHFFRDWCRCFSSFCNSPGVEQTVLALWNRVPTTLYLEAKEWWLS